MKFSKEGILKRVKDVRERQCGTQHGSRAALARLLKINYNTLKTYEEESVNLDFLQLLAEKTGTDLYWLLFGEERLTESSPNHVPGKETNHVPCQVVPSMKVLPYYLSDTITLTDTIWVPVPSIFEIMSEGSHFCCVMDKEKPGGMEPVINRGDFVFVKRETPQLKSESFPVKGRIYLLRIKNDLIFRYLSPYERADGSAGLLITAENRSEGIEILNFPPDDEKAGQKARETIIGHVVYITRKTI